MRTKSSRNLARVVPGVEQNVVDLSLFAEKRHALGSWQMLQSHRPGLDSTLAGCGHQRRIQTLDSAVQIGLETVRNSTGSTVVVVAAAYGSVESGPSVEKTFALYLLPASEMAHSPAADLMAENIARSLFVALACSGMEQMSRLHSI